MMQYYIAMNDPLLFQYCQKTILFSEDNSRVLLAKRKGEQDYDGVFSLIGGKLETTDGGFVEGLKREKNEEIGVGATMLICPTVTYNVYFQKKDGHHMVLPHYIAKYTGGEIVINDEYSEYQWVALEELDAFEPKIENIPAVIAWARRVIPVIRDEEWVAI